MDVGLLTAFLGGTFALLSPCGALLLPAFFSSMAGTTRILLHGVIFYAGLLVVLVPLGVGAGALGSLFVQHRQTIVIVSAVVLIVLGAMQVLGLGFDPSRLTGTDVRARAQAATGVARTFLLGAASGVAGFCAGPILGAVLTVAAAQGNVVGAGALLAVYGAGMVVPLLLIAVLWQRLGPRGRRALRGRTFTFLGREFHTISVITGLLIIVVGVIFWTTNGLVNAPQLVPPETQAWLQERAAALANPAVDVVVVLLLLGLALWAWWRWQARRSEEEV